MYHLSYQSLMKDMLEMHSLLLTCPVVNRSNCNVITKVLGYTKCKIYACL